MIILGMFFLAAHILWCILIWLECSDYFMLIVHDRKVVTFFSRNFSSRSDDFLFFLFLSFSSLVWARILWSVLIKFQNCICYLFLMIVSHTVVFNISSHSFLGIFEMLIIPCLLLLMICLKIGFSFSSHSWVSLSFSTIMLTVCLMDHNFTLTQFQWSQWRYAMYVWNHLLTILSGHSSSLWFLLSACFFPPPPPLPSPPSPLCP